MIDSVVLQLESNQFDFADQRYFDGLVIKHINKHVTVRTWLSGFHKAQKKNGNYFPMVMPKESKVQRYKDVENSFNLEIQVSLPKLLFGTNILEVSPNDLSKIYKRLQEVLSQVGISVSVENLQKAVLKRVDFCKSIRLNGMYGSVNQVTKKLSYVGNKPRSKMRYRDYLDPSQGSALKFHNSTQGYCIYDKFGEVIANGYTDIEVKWIDWMKEHVQVRNMIRFELSLQRKQSLEAFLRRRIKGDKTKDFVLSDVMNINLAKQILLDVFDETFDDHFAMIISLSEMRENEVERLLLEKKLSLDKHAKLIYLVNKATKIGLQPTLLELKERCTPSTYLRYKKEIIKLLDSLGDIKGSNPHLLRYLREKHEEFELIRLNKKT